MLSNGYKEYRQKINLHMTYDLPWQKLRGKVTNCFHHKVPLIAGRYSMHRQKANLTAGDTAIRLFNGRQDFENKKISLLLKK